MALHPDFKDLLEAFAAESVEYLVEDVGASTRTDTQVPIDATLAVTSLLIDSLERGTQQRRDVVAVDWSQSQRQMIERTLKEHPAPSGRCEQAARGVLPVAREVESFARARKLVPTEGWFVVPKVSVGVRWYEHFSVHVQCHYVDALTHTDGTADASYLDEHWKHTDGLA